MEIVQILSWNPESVDYLDLSNFPKQKLNFKYLERVRGFLCHLAMTYPTLFPYLNCFHLTLCAHLPGRDKEGWKRTDLEQIGQFELLQEKGIIDVLDHETVSSTNPAEVEPVLRIFWCLKALGNFFKRDSPPSRSVRKSKFHFLVYGFVDASKSCLGSIKS